MENMFIRDIFLKINYPHDARKSFCCQMANDICRKYCLLVKNFANPKYSKLTRDVIDYIRLHLEEELSLKYLADVFEKNAF